MYNNGNYVTKHAHDTLYNSIYIKNLFMSLDIADGFFDCYLSLFMYRYALPPKDEIPLFL